jgi:hypothetical protein
MFPHCRSSGRKASFIILALFLAIVEFNLKQNNIVQRKNNPVTALEDKDTGHGGSPLEYFSVRY